MIIKKVHIDGFGKWHNQDFTFSPGKQLIYGPNEAGKTTLMKFIISILFGFSDGRGKNRFEQYLPKNTSSYGGSVWIEKHGARWRIDRRQGKNGGRVTVTAEDGTRGGEEKLQQILGTMDCMLYQAIFSFGQRDLAAVDEINRQDWQQYLQQIGAVGSKRWTQLAGKLTDQADRLYKPRGRKWPLNQDLRKYQQLTTQIAQARGNYHRYVELRQQLKQAQQDIQQLQEKLATQQAKQVELERLNRLWPIYQKWRHKTPLTNLPRLSDRQVVKVQKLQVQLREVHHQRLAVQQRLTALDGGRHRLVELDQGQLSSELELKKQLIQLQAQTDFYHQQTVQAKKWQTEQTALQAKYHGQLPAPLSVADRDQLVKLLGHDRDRASEPSRQQLVGIVGGFVLFIFGLLFNSTFLTVAGAIIAFVIIMFLYHQKTMQHSSRSDNGAIAAFGKEHGLQAFPSAQWLKMQPDLQRNEELRVQLVQVKQLEDRLNQQLARIKNQLPPTITATNLADLNNQLDQLIQAHQQGLQEKEATAREGVTIKNNLGKLIARENQLQQEKMTLFAQAGVKDDAEFAAYLEQRVAQQTQAAKNDVYDQQLTAIDKKKLGTFASQEQLKDQLTQLTAAIGRVTQQLDDTRARKQKCKITIANLVKDGRLSQLEQERANLATQIWAEGQQWLTYQLAIRWIDRALSLASANRFPAIIKRATKFFAVLTGKRYRQINLTTAGLTVVTADQQLFTVEELSQGTAEQLYIALRLGFISVMNDQANLPVIIDDGFVNFDNVRRQRMLDLLDEIAKTNQVLYFTADDRICKLSSTVLNLAPENNEKFMKMQ